MIQRNFYRINNGNTQRKTAAENKKHLRHPPESDILCASVLGIGRTAEFPREPNQFLRGSDKEK